MAWMNFRLRNVKHLMEMINSGADLSIFNKEGDALIHHIIKKKRKDKLEMLLALLTYSDVDVNVQNWKGNTALHMAIEGGEVMCIRALLVFGADINKPGANKFTPLRVVVNNGKLPDVESLFIELGAEGSAQQMTKTVIHTIPQMHSIAENMAPLSTSKRLSSLHEFVKNQGIQGRLYQEVEANLNRIMSDGNFDDASEAVALWYQSREFAEYNKTLQESNGGSRILFLDGGGMKSLVQLEILMQIEEATGCTVIELFDWIVGVSTGGLIALALVYGRKSLSDLRQFFFKLKDRIFTKSSNGSKEIDDILLEYVNPDTRMADITYPKVIIAAADTEFETSPKLCFFNNCFGDWHCDRLVRNVARYTMASPMFFTEMDDYFDGGMFCNNPTEHGYTAIQKSWSDIKIAMVVSIGSGQSPTTKMRMADTPEALFFGKHWVRPGKQSKRAQEFSSSLSNALMESEMVAAKSERHCREQNIPFFRFSPELNETIAVGETDNEKLFSMIIQTKISTGSQRLSELVLLFHRIAETSLQPTTPSPTLQNDTSGQTLHHSTESKNIAILTQPKNTICNPGDKVEFTIKTSPTAQRHQWYLNGQEISNEDKDYEGSTTEHLLIVKCLPKHKGSYNCVVSFESDAPLTSKSATLKIDGEQLKEAEAKLLGEILKAPNIDFSTSGVDSQQLLDGKSGLTYEEMQFVMKDNPTTRILSMNLKQELQSRLQEEQVYQAAIARGKTVSLTYVKLLALGPGQIGKSTFLYRLLGLMEGNIEDSPKEAQPQSSTGQSELREVCIKYINMFAAAAPDLSWELCGLQSLIEGLMWLLSNQTQGEDYQSITSSSDVKTDKTKEASPQDINKSTNVAQRRMSEDLEPQNTHSINATESEVSTLSSPESGIGRRIQTPLTPPKGLTELINMAIVRYEKLRVEYKLSSKITKLHMLFNVADVGGQPAFLDMLPSITIGPALYLLFTKLVTDSGEVLSKDDLNKPQPVQYRAGDDIEPQDCENYTYTLQEVLFCALSSIACFGLSDRDVEKYVTKESETQKTSSLAVLFGTFADKINDGNSKRLTETEKSLRATLKRTEFYQNNLISLPNPSHPEHFDGQVFFRVNNKTGSRQEISQYRKVIQELVEQRFKKYDIPAAWLGLSICLKILATKRETYKVSFDDCAELGKHFNLNREEVKVALIFLHKYIGLVMYFPNDEYLHNLVICNPQVVFSSLSELTFNVYDSSSRKKKTLAVNPKQKKFEETGIFNPKEVSYPNESNEFMSIYDLVHLLVHLNIAAKICEKTRPEVLDPQNTHTSTIRNVQSSEEYFFPAILKTADTSSLVCDSTGVDDEILPEPLCIRFETGYIPMGFTCALSAKLMTEKQFSLAPEEQTLYKNKLKLRYNGQFNVTMISLPLRCEFHITRHYGVREFHDLCPEIFKLIHEAIDLVLKSMQKTLLSEVSYDFAFKCPNHQNPKFEPKPLAKFVYTDRFQTKLKHIDCVVCATTITDLKPEMKVWFGESLAISLSITKQPTLKENRILIQAEGTKPIKYQWLKDDEELGNGEDYMGSTTQELIIMETRSHVRGNYKCLVKHKYGEIVSSEIHYDPFIAVLTSKGISKRIIMKLIDHEIQSLEDLQYLQESVYEEMGLTVVEKSKLNYFISTSQTSNVQSRKHSDSAHESGGLHDNNGEDTCASIATVKPQLPVSVREDNNGASGIHERKEDNSGHSGDSLPSSSAKEDHHGQPSQMVELCTKFQLSNDNIDKEVSDEHILEIYPQLGKWKRVAAHLGLTQADVIAVESMARPDQELMRLYMLQEWKRKKRLVGTATYQVLLKVLIKCDCSESAIEVCKLLS